MLVSILIVMLLNLLLFQIMDKSISQSNWIKVNKWKFKNGYLEEIGILIKDDTHLTKLK